MSNSQFATAVVSILLATLIGCGSGASSNRGPAPPTASAPAPAEAAKSSSVTDGPAETDVPPAAQKKETVSAMGEPPEFTISAEELAKEYLDDAEAADKKYQRRTVRLDGKVHEVAVNQNGVKLVILAGDGDLNVECLIAFNSVGFANTLKPGQEASVVGQIDGLKDEKITVIFGELVR